ncbi:MAG: beta-N-acetylhexosaminidase [Caulobacteraceae bacterium]|nr:beta-N-acetylhexosaminidase [Caulobacteraceae bacterium]
MSVSAAIYGCSGHRLTAEERDFFAEVAPWGFILFKRNVSDPQQLAELTRDLRDAVGRKAPILVDQEGGRVQRMGPPHWRKYPPAAAFLEACGGDIAAAARLIGLSHRLMAADLRAVGINVDCAPVLDTPVEGAHDIIGDRAFAREPGAVTRLGRAAAEGLLAGGVLPVIKHIPGHGRAMSDSHHELPEVKLDLVNLDAWDFAPFKALNDLPAAMTAHVVFKAADAERPATTSHDTIEIIRERLGFDGLLMTDDLSMKALKGPLGERARRALTAGCDVVLHCNGDLTEMREVAEATGLLDGRAAARAEAALARIAGEPEPFDAEAAAAELQAALKGRFEAKAGPAVGEAP